VTVWRDDRRRTWRTPTGRPAGGTDDAGGHAGGGTIAFFHARSAARAPYQRAISVYGATGYWAGSAITSDPPTAKSAIVSVVPTSHCRPVRCAFSTLANC